MKPTRSVHAPALPARIVMAAAAAALLAWPVPGRAEGDRVDQKGPKVGTVTIKAAPQNFSNGIGSGSFTGIRATSTDSADPASPDTSLVPPPTPYVVAVPYATAQTSAKGSKFQSFSKVTAVVTAVTKTRVDWSATAATYGIDVLAPTGTSGESASASWIVNDPVHIDTEAGDPISISFAPDEGWSFVYADANLNYTGGISTFGSASTSLPGLTDLFHWNILTSTQTPGLVQVDFTSNPLLGLDDAAIASSIRARYTYDPATLDYNFDSTGFTLDAAFTAPSGVTGLDVTTSLGSEIHASAVPEPSALSLFVVGALSLLACARLRRGKLRRTGRTA